MAAAAGPVVLKMKASVISPAQQLAIVQYSDEHGVKAAADHFAVSQDRVCDWRSDRRRGEPKEAQRLPVP
jgi:hypothetical protein